MSENFNRDLASGHKAEEYIKAIIKQEHGETESFDGEDCDLVSEDGYMAEVKYDKESRKTKYIGIEYEYKGRDSGIYATLARDWWHIYKLDKWGYTRVPVSDLKRYIWEIDNPLIVKGGDSSKSKMLLLDKHKFAQKFGFNFINHNNEDRSSN